MERGRKGKRIVLEGEGKVEETKDPGRRMGGTRRVDGERRKMQQEWKYKNMIIKILTVDKNRESVTEEENVEKISKNI